MRFWFDRSIPPRMAEVIQAYDPVCTIRHHFEDQRFDPETPDDEWFSVLSSEVPPWAIVTHDRRLLRNRTERAVLRDAGMTFFILTETWMKKPFTEQTWRLVRAWPNIVTAAANDVPCVYSVPVTKRELTNLGPTAAI